ECSLDRDECGTPYPSRCDRSEGGITIPLVKECAPVGRRIKKTVIKGGPGLGGVSSPTLPEYMKLERIRNLILFPLYSRGRSKRGSAEFLAVSIGVVASLGKHPFVVTIPAYLI